MTTTTLDKRTLERFSYYMTFFEHALNLKDNDIVARRLVAPDFDDFKSIKKRVAQVLLKALRSSALFDFPRTFESENVELTLKSIARWRKQEEELERYMRFILEVEAKTADVGMFPYDSINQCPDMTVITDPEVRDYFFDSIVQGTQNRDRVENPLRAEFIQNLKDSYEIVIAGNMVNHITNPLGALNLGLEDITVSARDVRFNSVQEHIDTQGVSYFNRYSDMSLTGMIREFHFKETLPNGEGYRRTANNGNYYANSYPLIPTKIWNSPNAFEKLGEDNIYIAVEDYRYGGWNDNVQDKVNGSIILARKVQVDDKTTIIPNLVRKTIRYDIRYSRGALLSPGLFMDVNRQLVDSITNRYRVIGNDNENTE